ncbi:predicted inorganic polyphosphate / ATP-NAD+ kinase [Prochlorococcus marinus str. MIT 9515]|uniref:NAD kinase n=1 Tax=Prochlorococcus marinus (strain MIT 9515) TaxID=167542 RepID=A2BUD3_PROM5|nr:predicted inorganic polyphosphate / ATP-NAD+ kinase [Prochlorococcus marinus str. MIT 9515]
MLIIYRSNSSVAKEASIFCEKALKDRNIKSKSIGSDFDTKKIEQYLFNLPSLPDLLIVLGGDGTVLKSANALVHYDIPLLSFNIGGNLGFLTQEKDFLFDKSFIKILEKEEFTIDLRNRLHCEVYSKENLGVRKIIKSYDALNDFYFKSVEEDISPTNQIQIEIDNEKVNEYKGDGLIISSSTGSTAYSMAAGGPIVHPSINAFVINPICPMSLASRPIIIPDTSKVIIRAVQKNKREIKLWKDGSKCMTVKENDYCEINKGTKPCKMIKFNKSISYYITLIKKLDWKGNLSLKNNQLN